MALLKESYKEPILPNKGAAGIKLGITTSAVNKLWGEPPKIEKIATDLVHWEYQDIGLWFKAEKLDQIGIQGSYEGKIKNNLGLGSTRYEVEEAYGPLTWDGTWMIDVPPFGIGFEFSPYHVGEPRVIGIYIFRE